MFPPVVASVCASLLLVGCASSAVRFPNAGPHTPLAVPGALYRPAGSGPFPAVVLLHACHGVSSSTREWARWFSHGGYVALVVDSWTPRGITATDGCLPDAPDVPSAERLDDAFGAVQFLQSSADVDRTRIGAIGWSNGGVHAIALVNGPSHDRARARGVSLPDPGVQASVALYPGGCFSLVAERVVKPLLVLMGDADDWTVPGPCLEMVEAMKGRGAPASIVLYPGAFHYFDVRGQARTFLAEVGNRNRASGAGATVAFDAAAAADARRRVQRFFAEHVSRR